MCGGGEGACVKWSRLKKPERTNISGFLYPISFLFFLKESMILFVIYQRKMSQKEKMIDVEEI